MVTDVHNVHAPRIVRYRMWSGRKGPWAELPTVPPDQQGKLRPVCICGVIDGHLPGCGLDMSVDAMLPAPAAEAPVDISSDRDLP
jgi:hypothetical protein